MIILILIISLIFFFYGNYKIHKAKGLQHTYDIEVELAKQEIQNANNEYLRLEAQKQKLEKETFHLLNNKANLIEEISKEKEKTDKIHEEEKNRLSKLIIESQERATLASEQYFQQLEMQYLNQEKDFDNKIAQLQINYENEQAKYQELFNQALAALNKIQATRDAAIAASLKEQEIKEKSHFYCLNVRQDDLNDIKVLEEVKTRLRNPRILSMLIWSTYFQKDMTTLCNRVLGIHPVIGIYKITNQQNNKCYIGQSVDVSKRWKDHAKCGLGIDTPVGNKLYKEMQEIGIWNFSWELLEECPRADLNEKERFYIDLYKSKDYGYNTVKGVS